MNQSKNYLPTVAIVVIAVALTALVTYMIMRQDSQPVGAPEQTTGEQVTPDQPQDDASEPADGNEAPANNISAEDAERIATERFGGTVVEVEQDSHNDRPTWEVKIVGSSEGDIEVEVDRETGEIVAWDRD